MTIIGIVVLFFIASIVILLIASTINHTYKLNREFGIYPPPGVVVEVDSKKLHVYTEGEGEDTLVFMAGHGTNCPTLDFKPLWMRMTDDYRIAVVERSGYGWSDRSNTARDIDTMLEETRKALSLAGNKGPFVLFPHSMSGLEAIYWAQKYPDEIKAVIGLDAATPAAVEKLPDAIGLQLYAMYFIARTGLTRFMPDEDIKKNFPLLKSDDLSREERQKYLALFYRNAFNRNMLNEIKHLHRNAEKVSTGEMPSKTPMYFFISDDQEANFAGWEEDLTSFLSTIEVGRYMKLDTGHYVHYDQAEVIAAEARSFLLKRRKQR